MELPNDTKPCDCGKRMILRFTGDVLLSYPAQHPTMWFCGGCGWTEEGPTLRDGLTKEEADQQRWEKANQ